MSGRPVPVTRSDEILCAVFDELVGLRQDLADRDGASVTAKAPAASDTSAPPAKKTVGKKTRTEVTGR